MVDINGMQMGETLPLSEKTQWEAPENRDGYEQAMMITAATGKLFEITTLHAQNGAISGFTITRTK